MTLFRTALRPELDLMLDWAAQEGWNPGLDDAQAFYAADPAGFFLAVDADDQPLGAISVVNHSASFAFLGLYLVRPEQRGQGIGLGLWHHATQHAGQRVIGLDGVEAQQGNYARSGFAHAGGTTRFSGQIGGALDPEIAAATPQDIGALIAQEAAASGVEKPAYLTAWLTPSQHRTTLVLRDTAGIKGFCTARTCQEGGKIGPLLADSAATAQRLIAHAAHLTQGPITLDVPGSSAALTALCQELGLAAGFQTARMYKGPAPNQTHPLYAVTSLELG